MPTLRTIVHVPTGEFRRDSKGTFECGPFLPEPPKLPGEEFALDPNYVVVEVPRTPDQRTEKWNGSAVVAKSADEIAAYDLAQPKPLNTRDLIRRMTTAERAFLFRAAMTNDTAAAWLLMLITDGTTDVHSVEWSGGVAFFVQAGVSAGVWPDTATANARVAEITA